MNPFSERFKSNKNSELLNIIENPTNYQILAVEAAKDEIAMRQLSLKEITEAKVEIDHKVQQKEKYNEKLKSIENNIKAFLFLFYRFFSPRSTKLPHRSKNNKYNFNFFWWTFYISIV